MGSRFHSLGRAMGNFDCSLRGPFEDALLKVLRRGTTRLANPKKRQRPNCSETPRTASTLGTFRKRNPYP